MIFSLLLSSTLFFPQALPENLPSPYIGLGTTIFRDDLSNRISYLQTGLFWKLKETRSREFGDMRWVLLTEMKVGSNSFGLTGAYGFQQSYDLGPRHRRFFLLYGLQGGGTWMTRTAGDAGNLLAGTLNAHMGPEWKYGEDSSFYLSFTTQWHLGFISNRLARWGEFEALSGQIGFLGGLRF